VSTKKKKKKNIMEDSEGANFWVLATVLASFAVVYLFNKSDKVGGRKKSYVRIRYLSFAFAFAFSFFLFLITFIYLSTPLPVLAIRTTRVSSLSLSLLLYTSIVALRLNSDKGPHSEDPKGRRLHYDYGVCEKQGKRPYMEDRHVVHGMLGGESVTLYGVFDGHGGSQAAQYCKDKVGKALVNAVEFPQDPEQALTEAILTVDKNYLRDARKHNRDDGTTLILCMVQGDTVTCANVGDSRAVLVKCDGNVEPLSYDHKPNSDSEKARIEALGGKVVFWGVWRVEGILAVSRAIGDRMLKKFVSAQPDFVSANITADDTYMVMASDGLWDVMENDEVGRLCSKIKNAHKAAEYLAKEAYKRGSADNICVLVVDLRTGGDDADNEE